MSQLTVEKFQLKGMNSLNEQPVIGVVTEINIGAYNGKYTVYISICQVRRLES